jgi:hypothetical protein
MATLLITTVGKKSNPSNNKSNPSNNKFGKK